MIRLAWGRTSLQIVINQDIHMRLVTFLLLFFLPLFFVGMTPLSADAQELDWTVVAQSGDNEFGTAIATSKQGAIYSAGTLGGAITFGAGEPAETSLLGHNYVMHQAPDGTLVWAASIFSDGGPLDIEGIDIDKAGNVYIAGALFTGDNYTFGPGEANETTISTNGNSSDAFIARFDKFGMFDWVRQGGLGEDNRAYGIAVASNGDSYTTGFYRSHIIFGEEGNTPAVDLFSEGGALDNDIFVVKFDKRGNLAWAKSAGGAAGADVGFAIDLNGNKDILVSGHFNDHAIFGKDTPDEVTINSDGSLDGFLARYSTAGDPVWALQLGGAGPEQARAVAALKNRVVVLGWYTTDFNMASTDATTTAIPAILADNLFIGSYDIDGVLDWAGAINMDDFPTGSEMDIDFGLNGQVCALANFQGTGIWGVGQDGVTVLNAPVDPEMFAACYKDNGILQWAAADPVQLMAGTVDNEADIVVTGGFQNTVTFGPGDPNEVTHMSDGFRDIYLAKYTNQTPALSGFTTRAPTEWAGASDTVEGFSSETSPDNFRLGVNYPNPFNPQTTISVSLAEAAQVSFVVYDMLGREVVRLMDGQQAAGTHEVVFSASDLPSGIYLYKLISPAGEQARTMLLMK